MAQIKARRTSKGITRYTAYIRMTSGRVVLHQESRTFPRHAQAVDWARRREVELSAPGAVARVKLGEVTIGPLIQRYIDEFESTAQWQRTKAASLRALIKMEIANQDSLTLDTARLVQHIRERRAQGTGPATAGNDLIWLGVVLRTARAAWNAPVNPQVVADATILCRQLRLIGKAKERVRTPTYEELEKLDAFFERQDKAGRAEVPMRPIMWFALYSTRRESEICRLLWADNDDHRKLGIVRDAKHPREKIGNHRDFRYTPKAWAIMQMQPKDSPDGRIFPYESKAIGARFTRACKLLGIEDLHFHDLRHEGTTRLFEQGLTIPEVAAHTLHESWAVLKRYTHIIRRGKVLDAPFLPPEPSPAPSPEPPGPQRGARRGAAQDQPA